MNFPPKSTLQKKRLAVAVNAALCLLAPSIAVISETAQAQPPVNISISDDNSFIIFLSESEFPVGGDLIIEETGSADAIDHTSFDGTSVWNVTINGIIRGYVYGIDDYDSIKLENGSSVTVGATGQASPIELWDGGTVINNGLIEGLVTGDDSDGTSAIVSNSGRDGIGSGESFYLENNGTIRVLRNIAIGSGGLDEVEITNNGTIEVEWPAAVGLDATSVNSAFVGGGALSTTLSNTGTIDVGFDSIQPSVAIVNVNATYDPELEEFTLIAPTGTTTIFNAEGATIRGTQIFDNTLKGLDAELDLVGQQTGGATGYQLNFDNNGTLIASGGDAFGNGGAAIEVEGAVNFTNTGTITIDAELGFQGNGEFFHHYSNGIADQVLNFTNTADGVISFTQNGITTDAGTINNDGVLQHNSLNDTGYAIFVSGVFADRPQSASVLVNNAGSISHTRLAIFKGFGSEELVVNNSGTITAGEYAIFVAEGGLNLTNQQAGTINGDIAANPNQNTDTFTEVVILNEGTINGNVSADTGNDSISNSGSIVGSLSLGGGNDTVSLSGSVTGIIDLGEGDDALVLSGSGTASTGSLVEGGVGTDTLTLQGSGTLDASTYDGFEIGVVEGDNWTVNGAVDLTEINLVSGLLQFNDAVSTNSLTVASGAQLVATDISGSVSNAGTYSIGGNGSLAAGVINGDFVNTTSGVLVFDALDSGLSDTLVISGTATLEGGELMTLSNDAAWSVARDYTVLSAQGGLSGEFATVSSNLAYLTPTLSYTNTDVQLSLTRRNAEIQTDILETTNTQQLSVANRVVPNMIQNQVGKQLLVNFSSASTVAALPRGSLSTGLSAGDETGGSRNIWLNLTPTRYERDAILPGSNDRQNIDGQSINFMLGADMTVGSRGVVGVFAGYEESELDIDSIAGEQDTDGFMFGAYAGVALNDWLFASANGYWASLSTTLEEQAFGVQEVQVADYDSDRYGLGVDLTAVKNIDAWSLTGQVAYTYTNESYDSYVTGSGDTVDLGDLSLGRFSVGAELGYAGDVFTPYVAVNYESDTSVDQVDYDDNGTVLSAGLRAVTERFYFDAYLSSLQGRDNEDLTMFGLNASYSL